MVLKHTLVYLLMSITVVLFANYAHFLIVYMDIFYTYINLELAPVFSNSNLGVAIRRIITLVGLPLLIAAIPALLYRTIRGQHMPYFLLITWLLWLVIVLSNILI